MGKVQISIANFGEVDAITPVIISASRATDIPAFFANWFMARLRAGYCTWKNPFNQKVQHVSFAKTRVIVFWTKNPAPLLPYLDEIEEMGANCDKVEDGIDFVCENPLKSVGIVVATVATGGIAGTLIGGAGVAAGLAATGTATLSGAGATAAGVAAGVVAKKGLPEAAKAIAINRVIDYGKNKMGGGHDHRTNTGQDRTPAQKEDDMKRRNNA